MGLFGGGSGISLGENEERGQPLASVAPIVEDPDAWYDAESHPDLAPAAYLEPRGIEGWAASTDRSTEDFPTYQAYANADPADDAGIPALDLTGDDLRGKLEDGLETGEVSDKMYGLEVEVHPTVDADGTEVDVLLVRKYLGTTLAR